MVFGFWEHLTIPGNRIFAIIFVVWAILPYSAFAQPSDIVFVNGKVLTVDTNFSTHQAVAVGEVLNLLDKQEGCILGRGITQACR